MPAFLKCKRIDFVHVFFNFFLFQFSSAFGTKEWRLVLETLVWYYQVIIQ